jgi:CRP-like cAMP-binding protein
MNGVNPQYLDAAFGAQQLGLHVPFRGLPPELLRSIYALGHVVRIEAFSNVIIEGENSAGMFIVFEGMVGIYKSESSSRKGALLKTLGSGQTFGEMSLLDRAPRSATVTAEVGTVLFEFNARSWDELVSASPDLGAKLYRNFAVDMAARLRALNDDLVVSQRQLWRYTFSKGRKD